MGEWKLYRRILRMTVRARVLGEREIVYDLRGDPIVYNPGDVLIEGSEDRYVMSPDLFSKLYMEVSDGDASN